MMATNETRQSKPPAGAKHPDESGHDPSQRNLCVYMKMIDGTDWPRFWDELRKAQQNSSRDENARRKS